MKSRRLRRAAVAVVCAVALSGCASAHPGSAAEVGDTSISDDTLQQSTAGFCDLIASVNAAQQGSTTDVPLRSAVLTALNTLVMGEALDQLAARNNVSVSNAEVRGWIDQLPLDFSTVPAPRIEDLQAVTSRVARNTLLVEKLGRVVYERQNPGGGNPPPNQIQQLGQQLASGYLNQVDVETNPRYGQVLDTQRLPGTGSLSLPVSEEGMAGRTVPQASGSLSESQKCS